MGHGRTRRRSLAPILVLGIAGLASTACLAPDKFDPVPISAEEASIRLAMHEFKSAAARHYRSTNPRTGSRLEVAEYVGPKSQAVVVGSVAGPGLVIGRGSTESMVESILEDAKVQWQDGGTYGVGPAAVGYRRFVLAERSEACVGFQRQRRPALGDDLGRNTNLLYGFYCQAGRDRLGDTKVNRLLSQIDSRY